MAYEERNVWSGIILTIVAVSTYVIVLLRLAGGGPLTDVVWWPAMLWTIGGGIVVTIVVRIVWGAIAGRGDSADVRRSDQRDRDIARMGDRVGQAFLVIAGVGVIVLCAVGAEPFWIAHAMFFGFALSALVGGVASVIAYRRGLV